MWRLETLTYLLIVIVIIRLYYHHHRGHHRHHLSWAQCTLESDITLFPCGFVSCRLAQLVQASSAVINPPSVWLSVFLFFPLYQKRWFGVKWNSCCSPQGMMFYRALISLACATDSLPTDSIWAMMFVWRQEVRLSELFCVVLCTEVVHSHKHT